VSSIVRFSRLLILFLAIFASAPAPALAAVELSFYSKDFGSSFPHAYIALKGAPDGGGDAIDDNFGFTAAHISPAILAGSVKGEIIAVPAPYMASSDRHVSFDLSDDEYRIVQAAIQRWRDLKQPSYNLNQRNCVHFVADIAASIGMVAGMPRRFVKKPRSYLDYLVETNRNWLERRGATIVDRHKGRSR
jgi:hypothetical protein